MRFTYAERYRNPCVVSPRAATCSERSRAQKLIERLRANKLGLVRTFEKRAYILYGTAPVDVREGLHDYVLPVIPCDRRSRPGGLFQGSIQEVKIWRRPCGVGKVPHKVVEIAALGITPHEDCVKFAGEKRPAIVMQNVQ